MAIEKKPREKRKPTKIQQKTEPAVSQLRMPASSTTTDLVWYRRLGSAPEKAVLCYRKRLDDSRTILIERRTGKDVETSSLFVVEPHKTMIGNDLSSLGEVINVLSATEKLAGERSAVFVGPRCVVNFDFNHLIVNNIDASRIIDQDEGETSGFEDGPEDFEFDAVNELLLRIKSAEMEERVLGIAGAYANRMGARVLGVLGSDEIVATYELIRALCERDDAKETICTKARFEGAKEQIDAVHFMMDFDFKKIKALKAVVSELDDGSREKFGLPKVFTKNYGSAVSVESCAAMLTRLRAVALRSGAFRHAQLNFERDVLKTLVTIVLLGELEFEPNPISGAPSFCKHSEWALESCVKNLQVEVTALEQTLLCESSSADEARAARDRLAGNMLESLIRWIAYSSCSFAIEKDLDCASSNALHVWIHERVDGDTFVNILVNSQMAELQREQVDVSDMQQFTSAASAITSQSFTSSSLQQRNIASNITANRDFQALYLAAETFKPMWDCTAASCETNAIDKIKPLTNHWIRCVPVPLSSFASVTINRGALLRELNNCGVFLAIKAIRALPVHHATFMELMSLASMIGAQVDGNELETSRRVMDAFGIKDAKYGKSRAFFRDCFPLQQTLGNARLGRELDDGLQRCDSNRFANAMEYLRNKHVLGMTDAEIAKAEEVSTRERVLEQVKTRRALKWTRPTLHSVIRTVLAFQGLARGAKKTRATLLASGPANLASHEEAQVQERYCVFCQDGMFWRFANEWDARRYFFKAYRPQLATDDVPPVMWRIRSARVGNFDDTIAFAAGNDESTIVVVQFLLSKSVSMKTWTAAFEPFFSVRSSPIKASTKLLLKTTPSRQTSQKAVPSLVVETESKAGELLKELIETERAYVNDLHHLILHYRRPLEIESETKGILTRNELDMVFGNVAQVLKANQELMNSLDEKAAAESFAQAFTSMVPFLKGIYTMYVQNYPNAMSTLSRLIKQKPKFAQFIQNIAQTKSCPDLESYLIKPIQRLCKYPLFFKQLDAIVAKGHHEEGLKHAISDALFAVTQVANQVNLHQQDAIRTARGMQLGGGALEGLTSRNLCEPGRVYLGEFACTLTRITGNNFGEDAKVKLRHVFVYSDALIVAKQVGDKFKFRFWLDLDHVVFDATGEHQIEIVHFPQAAQVSLNASVNLNESIDDGCNNSPMSPSTPKKNKRNSLLKRLSFGRSPGGNALSAMNPLSRSSANIPLDGVEKFVLGFASTDDSARRLAMNELNHAAEGLKTSKENFQRRMSLVRSKHTPVVAHRDVSVSVDDASSTNSDRLSLNLGGSSSSSLLSCVHNNENADTNFDKEGPTTPNKRRFRGGVGSGLNLNAEVF